MQEPLKLPSIQNLIQVEEFIKKYIIEGYEFDSEAIAIISFLLSLIEQDD